MVRFLGGRRQYRVDPHAIPHAPSGNDAGVHINFMSGDEEDRVPEAYRENWHRLIAVKSKYDPRNLLRLNQNIPRAGQSTKVSQVKPFLEESHDLPTHADLF